MQKRHANGQDRRDYDTKYREANRDRIRANNKKHREKNLDKIRTYDRHRKRYLQRLKIIKGILKE